MGYYTELKLDVLLNENAPLDFLEKLSSGEMWEELALKKFGQLPGIYSVEEEPELPIEHSFGKSKRWSQIFNPRTTVLDKNNKSLKIECEIKAYDEIYEKLLNWLDPYILSGTVLEKGEDQEEWVMTY